jgi:hypothetical protein
MLVPVPSLQQARVACAFAAVTTLACAGLLAAAALVPAPPGILAAVIVVSIGCSMAAGFELSRAVVALRAARRARAELRGTLDALPETPHPLDL